MTPAKYCFDYTLSSRVGEVAEGSRRSVDLLQIRSDVLRVKNIFSGVNINKQVAR